MQKLIVTNLRKKKSGHFILPELMPGEFVKIRLGSYKICLGAVIS